MKKRTEIELDFEIDKLTNSIENALTGEVFDTEITRIHRKDSKQIKKTDWGFDWGKEFKDPANEIYKLTTTNNPTVIHGLFASSTNTTTFSCLSLRVQNSTKDETNFTKV